MMIPGSVEYENSWMGRGEEEIGGEALFRERSHDQVAGESDGDEGKLMIRGLIGF